MLNFHLHNKSSATVGMHNKKVKVDLGVLQTNESNQITGYVEKPTLEYKVSMGIYFMEIDVLRYIPQNQRYDLPDLISKLLEREERVVGFPFEGIWLDIGRQDDYARAIDIFEKNKSAFLTDIQT